MSTNPESHPVGHPKPTVDVAPHSRFQSVLDVGKNLTVRAVAVIGIAASAVTAESAVSPPAAVADTGGYPDSDAADCSAIFGTYSWCKDENGNHSFGNGEQWSSRGYDYRNCTDWAAWRAPLLTGRSVPSGLGNAAQWNDNAPAAWIKDGVPEPGDIAQSETTSPYGHVGVVESYKKNVTGVVTEITVSEYNKAGDGNYTSKLYTPDANGVFWRSSGKKWDTFLDLNGTGKGINGEDLTNGGDSSPARTHTSDINKDGNDDLLLITHDGDGATGANVGLSTNAEFWFQPEWWRDPYTDFAPMVPLVGDVTGDGKADLTYMIPTATGSQAWTLKSTGTGFEAPQLWWNGTGYQFNGIKPAIGDVSGDGKADLVLVTSQSPGGLAVSAAVSTGNAFSLQMPWHTDGFTDWNKVKVLSGDVNGDGTDDVTMLVGTPDGSDAWVQLSHKTGLNGPQLWWDGAGYMFDGIKPVMGDVNADGTDDLVLATRQADGSTAVSPLLSTGTGYWLQSPWWTDVYTDWTHMTPTIGNFTGSRHNTRPIADFGFIAPTTNGVRAWVLPSTRTGLQSPQSWRIMNGWGWSGVKMGRTY